MLNQWQTRWESVRLTTQTWAALASALIFVVLALSLALAPVPYVVYSPGSAYDVLGVSPEGDPIIEIKGAPTFPTTGEMNMTTVSMTKPEATTSVPEILWAYWAPSRDALPRDSVYARGKTTEQVRAEERQSMDTSQQDAMVAALRAANLPVQELPVVSSVTLSGPSNGLLQPGDLFVAVNGAPVATPEAVRTAIEATPVGDELTFAVLRDRVPTTVVVPTVASNSDPLVPVIGVEVGVGYAYGPEVTFGVGSDIGGPSAGLVFAVGLYDKLTPEDLLVGRSVAGTGEIDANGNVGAIGGLQQKIAAAEESGITVFLVPGVNCRDLAGLTTKMDLIRADTLSAALDGLRWSRDPKYAGPVPRC